MLTGNTGRNKQPYFQAFAARPARQRLNHQLHQRLQAGRCSFKGEFVGFNF